MASADAPRASPPGRTLPTDDAEELYDSAPCGYLSTLMDGTIIRINTTLLRWLGADRAETVVGRRRFADLLTAGGRLYHETHFAPLLRMRGEIGGVALELRTADGSRLPVLVSSTVKHDAEGVPQLIRTTVFDASDRRTYEEELLRQRKAAEQARREAEAARRQADGDRTRLEETFRVLQQALLPPELPTVPGLELACHYRPASAERLGGDFYDVFEVGGDRWAFFLGDVSGSGPEAAAVTSLTRYTLRAAAFHDQDPLGALEALNEALYGNNADGDADPRYCTAVVGFLEPDPERGEVRVRLVSGGHPPALILRAEGGAEYLETPGGMLVGVVADADFVSAATTLEAGDTMLLYTDGLTEARTGERPGELFGGDGLREFARGLARRGPDGLVAEVRALLDRFGDALEDDTALLALGAPARPPGPSAT
ncbi:PP2C family protein-serine/threonine phosphatase [Streptomyces abyssomicinicus]|uniref:PP2C family protein-serine/threonine phosphatase n=1 Tax=Streptomyces abyssomicinicus TaxID=574929 RepID=UPI001FEAB79B|nr:SpoIIE family protein phosphatase [Streptomyces abyssomicinicus]